MGNPESYPMTAADYGDIMVDLETTGTRPDRTGILQIAAVRFDLLRGRVSGEIFQACLTLPRHRHWDEGTRHWWLHDDRRTLLAELMAQQEDWKEVMERFHTWVGNGKPTFWSKPLSFDFCYLASYFDDAGLANPFHYRQANDLNSFIRARYWPQAPALNEYNIGETGQVHNAIDDCFHQIKLLMKVMEDTKRD